MRYVRRGSGAVIGVGEVFVKASTVSRRATFARLEKRLGPYEALAHDRTPEQGTRHSAQAPEPAAHPSEAKPLVEAARSWQDLHRALGQRGLRYVRKGSGALVIADGPEGASMKASAVARSAALRQLERRLGPYEATGAEEGPAEKQMPRWADYAAERADHEAARHAAWVAFEAEREEEERALAERQREEREVLFHKRSWEGLLRALYLQRSLLAAQHAEEKAALEDKRRRERAALLARYPPWPDYPRWVRDPALAALWRERTHAPPSLEPESAPQAATGQAHDIRDYEARTAGHWVLYATRAQHARGDVAFVDHGTRITLHARDDREAATLAAMQLASAKWGRFRVRGSEDFKRRSARLAAEHGFELVNPELQDLVKEHRRDIDQRREEERYGLEAARLARAIRGIGETHGTARLVFDPPPGVGDPNAPRRITAVDGAGARHELGRHDVDTVALAKACARGQAPRPSLASRLETRRARPPRARSQTAPSAVPQPSAPQRRPGRGIGD